MITRNVSVTLKAILFVALSLMVFSAGAQRGVPFRLDEVQDKLVEIESGIDGLDETLDEIVLVDSSLCDRPVSWNRKLDGNERFAPALNGHAFCDLETGLVWTETPASSIHTWGSAKDLCRVTEIDGRLGWHLPTIEQLQSLVDQQNEFPALPVGHPFQGVESGPYWTSTPDEDSVYGQFREVWLIDMGSGGYFTVDATDAPFAGAWCVRGGVSPLPISDVNLWGREVDPNPD